MVAVGACAEFVPWTLGTLPYPNCATAPSTRPSLTLSYENVLGFGNVKIELRISGLNLFRNMCGQPEQHDAVSHSYVASVQYGEGPHKADHNFIYQLRNYLQRATQCTGYSFCEYIANEPERTCIEKNICSRISCYRICSFATTRS